MMFQAIDFLINHGAEIVGGGLVLVGGWLYGRGQRRRNRRKKT